MKTTKFFVMTGMLCLMLFSCNSYCKRIVKDGGNYVVETADNQELQEQREYLRQHTAGEHPLARMQRVAHSYAYGDNGPDRGWDDRKLLTRIKADGFTVVQTFKNTDDGTAALVLQDDSTGEYIISVRGSDDGMDFGADYKEAREGQSVGVNQYANNSSDFRALLTEYSARSPNGKVIVAGHSLGGGLSGILARKYPELVSKGYIFQGPAQTDESAELFNQIPEDKRPEMFLAVAAPDAVAYVGDKHIGDPKVYVAYSGQMYQKEGMMGHGTRFFQNKGLKDWTGKDFIHPDENVALSEFDYQEYSRYRDPYAFRKGETKVEWLKKWNDMGPLLSMRVIDRFMEKTVDEFFKNPGQRDIAREVSYHLERQVHLLKREKNLIRYIQHLNGLIQSEQDMEKKSFMEQDLSLLNEMAKALENRRKKQELDPNVDELVKIWSKRLTRVLGMEKRTERTSKDFTIKISNSKSIMYTGASNKIYMNSKGGKPDLKISGAHTGTYPKLFGTTFVYTAPSVPGDYQISIKAVDADGFVARDSIPVKVIDRPKWPVTLQGGDVNGQFYLYPENRQVQGEFNLDGIRGKWFGKYDLKTSWMHGKTSGVKDGKTLEGDFAARLIKKDPENVWSGEWNIGDLKGKFTVTCTKLKKK